MIWVGAGVLYTVLGLIFGVLHEANHIRKNVRRGVDPMDDTHMMCILGLALIWPAALGWYTLSGTYGGLSGGMVALSYKLARVLEKRSRKNLKRSLE